MGGHDIDNDDDLFGWFPFFLFFLSGGDGVWAFVRGLEDVVCEVMAEWQGGAGVGLFFS